MKVLTFILVLFLVFGSLFSLAVSIVGNHAIDAMTEQSPNATDIIMKSRQTPAHTADRLNMGWLGAGLLAIVLVSMGAVVFAMRGGSDLLKQWRLTFKKSTQRRPMPPLPYTPYSPDLREIPNAPAARQMREVNEYEEQSFDYPG
ncbi:MAG: hypothetical protein GY803_03315 [Chloroflexi bacterium]|nr:hypothetical protein [Chloroflexota bacterium]